MNNTMSDIIYTSKYAVDRMDPLIDATYTSWFVQTDNATSGWIERSALARKLGNGLGWISTCSLSENSDSEYNTDCECFTLPRKIESIDHLLTEVDECELEDEKSCVDPSESCTTEYDCFTDPSQVEPTEHLSKSVIEHESKKTIGDKISDSLESSIFGTMSAEFSGSEYEYI